MYLYFTRNSSLILFFNRNFYEIRFLIIYNIIIVHPPIGIHIVLNIIINGGYNGNTTQHNGNSTMRDVMRL